MAQTHQQLFIAFLIAILDLHSADLAPYHTSSFSFPFGGVWGAGVSGDRDYFPYQDLNLH